MINIVGTFQYNEGGNHIRPFIVLSLPTKWTSRNVAFYRSSGMSNRDSNHLANTWFPTFGFGTSDITKKTKILKACDISEGRCISTPILSRLAQFGCWMFSGNISRNDIDEEGITPANYVHTMIAAVSKTVVAYFCEEMHLFVSHRLGGGMWEDRKFRFFTQYIDSINPIPNSFTDTEPILSITDTLTESQNHGDNALILFLESNHAQIQSSHVSEYKTQIRGTTPPPIYNHLCPIQIATFNKRLCK